jgi:hypothetical protein
MISDPLPLAGLLETGVAIMVATRDADLRAHVTRAWGGHLDGETGRLVLALTEYPGSSVIANLESNGQIAITLARPLNYQSMQLKGVVESISDCSGEQLGRVRAHITRFVEEGALVGSPRVIERLAGSEFVQVRVVTDRSFEQTPGPCAGAELR